MFKTKLEALARNEKFYNSGKECIRGHTADRFASTGACKLCLVIFKAHWRSNPENVQKGRIYAARYAAQNKSILIQRRKNRTSEARKQGIEASKWWKENNRERVRAYGHAYKRANPAQNAARSIAYTAAKLRATPEWANHAKIAAVYAEARALTVMTGIRHEVDHILPLRGRNVCGFHSHDNLAAIPAALNRRKYNKLPDISVGYSKLVADTLVPAP